MQQKESLADDSHLYADQPGEGGGGVGLRGVEPSLLEHLAVGETVLLLHPPLPFAGVSTWINRGDAIKMIISPAATKTPAAPTAL